MRARTGLWCGLVIGVVAGAAAAQAVAPPPRSELVFQREHFFDETVRKRLEADIPADQQALIEWGGMYTPTYTFFNDVDNDHAHLTTQNLRLWTQIRLGQHHKIYARMRMQYQDWAAGDARGFRQHDLEGPNLEVGYYELDVTGAAKEAWGWDLGASVRARGGRQYVEVGRGIALAEYLDVGWLEVDTRPLRVEAFAGVNIESEDHIDRSMPGFSRSRRTFYGLEATVKGIPQHRPYVFWVLQRDWSEEEPEDLGQDYRYDSHYYGVGSRGALAARTRYAVEAIWEFGKAPAMGQENADEEIDAFAFDAQVDHAFACPMRPQVAVEYAYASGDDDRQSATLARLGNAPGTDDEAFQGFGYVNSGLALGARFTNLQFVRLGGRFTPYERKAEYGRLDVGANYYFLWKANAEGPITDVRATDTSSDVGQEIDVFAEWRIFSDLAWSVHYGRFYPGQAYADRQEQDFLFTALTFSF